MRIAGIGQGPRTERARPAATPAAGRGWVDPGPTRTIAEAPAASGPLAGGPVAPLAGLDALLVLQQVEDEAERRRRAARQGARLLDGLEELRRGLLEGVLSESTLRGLRRGLAELEATPEHPPLAAVLREIAVRVEVELAKLERATGGTGPPARPAEATPVGLEVG